MRVAGTSPAAGAFSPALLLPICSASIALALLSIWRGSPQAMLYYPVLVNAALLGCSRGASSTANDRERIARATTRDVPARRRPTSDT